MAKSMKDFLGEIKGKGNEDKTMTGKGSFSTATFSKFVHAAINDRDYRVTSVGKDGKRTEMCLSDLITGDIKKTVTDAKYPQKSEIGILDSADIATAGLAKAISPLVTEWVKTARKFPLQPQAEFAGDIYLASVPGKTKVVNVRDIKSGANIGTTTITSQDSVQVRSKSPVPSHLVHKVRRDVNGKVIS